MNNQPVLFRLNENHLFYFLACCVTIDLASAAFTSIYAIVASQIDMTKRIHEDESARYLNLPNAANFRTQIAYRKKLANDVGDMIALQKIRLRSALSVVFGTSCVHSVMIPTNYISWNMIGIAFLFLILNLYFQAFYFTNGTRCDAGQLKGGKLWKNLW